MEQVDKTLVEDVANIATLTDRDIRIAILAVPTEAVQQCAGVKGILNLSPCYLDVPKQVKVVTIDIAMELGILPYYI